MFDRDDVADLFDRFLKLTVLVEDNVVEVPDFFQFGGSGGEASHEDFRVIGLAVPQAFEQSGHGFRGEKEGDGVLNQLAQGGRALDVYLDDDIPPFGQALDDGAAGNTIVITVDERIFYEIIAVDPVDELLTGEENIMDTFGFAFAFRPGGGGDDILRFREGLPQFLNDGILANAGRARNDEDAGLVGVPDAGDQMIAIRI